MPKFDLNNPRPFINPPMLKAVARIGSAGSPTVICVQIGHRRNQEGSREHPPGKHAVPGRSALEDLRTGRLVPLPGAACLQDAMPYFDGQATDLPIGALMRIREAGDGPTAPAAAPQA